MTAWRLRKRTHLFSATKQASTHVAYETPIAFLALVPRIVVPIREVVVAAVVRHGERNTASGGSEIVDVSFADRLGDGAGDCVKIDPASPSQLSTRNDGARRQQGVYRYA